MASVLASSPVARAKLQACHGHTRAVHRPASQQASNSDCLQPPMEPTTIPVDFSTRSRWMALTVPVAVLGNGLLRSALPAADPGGS